jgi:general secretion pathway protein G
MRKRTASKNGRNGFTLIELLLVLVILGVLAAIVVPKFTGRGEDARLKAAEASIRTIDAALDTYEIDNGGFPSTEEGLNALVNPPANATNWKGPYLKGGLPKDPWGNDFIYRYPGTNNPNGFDITSLGKDGREGGDDIGNWKN